MDELKAAFDNVRAEESLIASTKDFQAKRRVRRPVALRLVPIAVCLCLLLSCTWVYATPTAQISVEINPLVTLTVNRFDRVIRAEGVNPEGKVLLEDLQLRHLSGVDAVERIMQQPLVAELMAEGEILSVGVIGEQGQQTRKLLQTMESCVGTAGEGECYYATPEELQQAQDMGLSCGKYRKLQRLQELQAELSSDEVQDMTMQQLHKQIAALEEACENQSQGQHHGYGTGEGEGNGNRHGHGKK